MGDTEKSAQLGDAMLLHEENKRNAAHLMEKLKKVQKAYARFGSHSDRWTVDPSEPGKVFLRHPENEERELPSLLLSQDQLAALLNQYDAARKALAESRYKLESFGITGV